MKVDVSYFAILREQRGLSAETLSTEAATPAELYAELRGQYRFSLDGRFVRAAVNDEFVPGDAALREGDRITFIPPVAGG